MWVRGQLFGRCGSGCGNKQDFINVSLTMWTLTRITVGVFADTSTRVGRLERVFEKGIMEIHLKVDRDRKEVPYRQFPLDRGTRLCRWATWTVKSTASFSLRHTLYNKREI